MKLSAVLPAGAQTVSKPGAPLLQKVSEGTPGDGYNREAVVAPGNKGGFSIGGF